MQRTRHTANKHDVEIDNWWAQNYEKSLSDWYSLNQSGERVCSQLIYMWMVWIEFWTEFRIESLIRMRSEHEEGRILPILNALVGGANLWPMWLNNNVISWTNG